MKHAKKLTLGIDTGGTYTDTVLLDRKTSQILGWGKSLTTYENFSKGIADAVAELASRAVFSPDEIEFAALSTTLATNAAVERRFRPSALILIGYDKNAPACAMLERELSPVKIFHVPGGHNCKGEETSALDEPLLRGGLASLVSGASAVAVSSLFGVRNPTHELRVKAIVEEETGLPVTCGHELSSKLDAYVRAATVSMNAGLIPILRELLFSVRQVLRARGVKAPLMVVRGDGTLVSLDWAVARPMETLLSGPVASAKGGLRLAEREGWIEGDLCCVVDIGGTTSDIAILENGVAKANPEGAKVGNSRTHINAIDVRTFALGGDILVTTEEKEPVLGATRVLPLGRLAEQYPGAGESFANAFLRGDAWAKAPLFVVPTSGIAESGDAGEYLSAALERGRPALLAELLARQSAGRSAMLRLLKELGLRGEIVWSSFTPTDALHVLGRLNLYDSGLCMAVAEKMAELCGMSAADFCERVLEKINRRLRKEIVKKAIQSDAAGGDIGLDGPLLYMITGERSLSSLAITAALRHTIVGIGAPAGAYMPAAAATIASSVVVPEFAMVAGAVGAASGGLRVSHDLVIVPVRNRYYRALLPSGPQDYEDLENAIAASKICMKSWMASLAEAAGAKSPKIKITEERSYVPISVSAGDAQVFLQATLHCEASQE